jgi:hypothetical protein
VVNLDADRAVLIVYIPEDQETPFITKDGRIYRRLSDSADPVPETNRYAIDRLVDKGKEVIKRYEKFCCDDRVFSEPEVRGAWVNLFLSPYPSGLINTYKSISIKELEKLLKHSRAPSKANLGKSFRMVTDKLKMKWSVPFDAVQLTYKSIIFKQVLPKQIAFNCLAIELFTDGSAKFYIPVPTRLIVKSQKVKKALRKFPKGQTRLLTYFDAGKLWMVILYFFNFYLKWLGKQPSLMKLKAAIIIDNVSRYVPIVDSDEFAEYIKKFGLPVLQTNTIRIPEEIGNGLPIFFDEEVHPWLQLCTQILYPALGLPVDLSAEAFAVEISKYFRTKKKQKKSRQ